MAHINSRGRLARFSQFLASDAGPGLLLVLVALMAMVLANGRWADGWLAGIESPSPLLAPLALALGHDLASWHGVVNDGLMAVFFFTVGLEIKREALVGNLATPAARRLPVLAAAAGMACPAAIYLAVVRAGGAGSALGAGWAVPAATDIAFALGVLGLLGRRVPASLRLFLLTVAVVDDLGAVAIIALAYTPHVAPLWLMGAAVVWAAMWGLGALRQRAPCPYLVLALALWVCVLHSGVHATVAGVLAALAIPLRPAHRDQGDYRQDHRQDRHSPALRLEHTLSPWCAWAIVPLFGLMNAGIPGLGAVIGAVTGGGPAGLVVLAVGLALAVGKPLGIGGAVALAARTGWARPPAGLSGPVLLGAGMLGGIGFTMSLFIGALAFGTNSGLDAALRLGILAGSCVSACGGALVLALAGAGPDHSTDNSQSEPD